MTTAQVRPAAPAATPRLGGDAPRGLPVPALVAAGLAAAGGVLTWMSFPGATDGWSAPLLTAPLGVAMLLLALRGRGPASAWWLGVGYGVCFLLPHLSWAGTYVGWLPLTALVSLQTAFLGLGGVLMSLTLRHRPVVAVLTTAAAWVAVEAARARVPFGGFGWGRLAFSQADEPTVGLAALGGAPLVTFAVVLAGALLADAAHRVWAASRNGNASPRPLARVGGVVAVALALLLSGALVPVPTGPQEGTLRVAGVQGNVPRPGLDFNAERRAVLDNHADATLGLAQRVTAGQTPHPDLVVWPENASDIDPLRNDDAGQVISRAVDAVAAPTLVGTLLRGEDDRLRNTTLVWEPGTGVAEGPAGRYVKRHPVPFAEYVPYRDFFRQITTMVDLVRSDMVAGERIGVLDVAGTTVGDLICFEVVDDRLVRDTVSAGARLLVVQTNNATFGYTDESVQQLAMSRLRAVEHGRAVAHVSTVGVSALIAPDGRVVDSAGLFTPAVLEADLPLRSTRTLAARLGAWPEGLLAGVGLLAAAAAVGVRHRRSAA